MLQFMMRHRAEIAWLALEHLWLVVVAMAIAIAVGVPLGIVLTRKRRLEAPVMGINNVIQTIPSLALLGFFLAVPWVGARAGRIAITVLTLYALLPIIRNTYVGITSIDPAVREAARAMGLTNLQLLWQVDLPLSFSTMLAGIRISTVLTIGLATIAAAIGAGGLGELIFRGLAMVDTGVILAGAAPAAALAIVADVMFALLERRFRVPPR